MASGLVEFDRRDRLPIEISAAKGCIATAHLYETFTVPVKCAGMVPAVDLGGDALSDCLSLPVREDAGFGKG